jgi:hypothetical protein
VVVRRWLDGGLRWLDGGLGWVCGSPRLAQW